MADFFALHQRSDLVLFNHDAKTQVGVIVRILQNAYLIRPLGVRPHESSSAALEVEEAMIEQKVGELDFSAVEENAGGFGFEEWAEDDLL